jgi:hypothetical protein
VHEFLPLTIGAERTLAFLQKKGTSFFVVDTKNPLIPIEFSAFGGLHT